MEIIFWNSEDSKLVAATFRSVIKSATPGEILSYYAQTSARNPHSGLEKHFNKNQIDSALKSAIEEWDS